MKERIIALAAALCLLFAPVGAKAQDEAFSQPRNKLKISFTVGLHDLLWNQGLPLGTAEAWPHRLYYDHQHQDPAPELSHVSSSDQYNYYKEIRRANLGTDILTFGLSAYYDLSDKFSVGLVCGWNNYSTLTRNFVDGTHHRRSSDIISIVPSARFYYANRPSLNVYSSIGVGLGIEHYSNNIPAYVVTKENRSLLTYECTLLGMNFGGASSPIYCIFEVGLGATGMVRGGLGYRL